MRGVSYFSDLNDEIVIKIIMMIIMKKRWNGMSSRI